MLPVAGFAECAHDDHDRPSYGDDDLDVGPHPLHDLDHDDDHDHDDHDHDDPDHDDPDGDHDLDQPAYHRVRRAAHTMVLSKGR